MKNLIQDGNILTFVAPSGGVVSGNGYLIGTIFGVATVAVAETLPFTLSVTGVYALPKAATITPAPGAKLYWDNAAKNVTTTSASNTLIGVHAASVAAGASDPTIAVRLGIVA